MAPRLQLARRPTAPPGQGRTIVTGFSPAATADIDTVVDHLNGNHADTVLLIARFEGSQPDASSAEVTRVDPDGLEVAVWFPDGSSTAVHLGFDVQLYAVESLRERLLALVDRARSAADDTEPLTSFEEAVTATAGLTTFVTQVTRIEEVAPGLRQITFGGGLEAYRSIGGDQFLYVVTADPSGKPPPPGFTIERLKGLPAHQQPPAAYYTVRRWRPAAAELDMWFVLHGSGTGVAGWAGRAAPGDRVAVWGPRRSYDLPAEATSCLLVADETGLAAVAAILDELDGSRPAHVVLEVADAPHAVDLPAGPHITIEWRFRNGAEPGTGTRLLDAVRELDLDVDGLYAFGAAEARLISAVRAHLRSERGLAARQVRMTGYWRRETVGR